MAKQKRLNKNLVAFLTIMLMVVVVSVFTLVIWQQSRRDPEVLAQSARESKQAGDLEEAARRFARAWDASQQRGEPNTKYAIDAAECLYEMGELGRWRALLEKTIAREPNDKSLPTALLAGLWHGVGISGGLVWPSAQWADLWRDTSLKLQQLDEKSVLAAASLARGLWELKGDENIAAGNKAAEDAFQWEPREPRAALTYIQLLDRRRQDEINAGATAGAHQAKLQAVHRDYVKQIRDVLESALEEHPGHVPLAIAYQTSLQREASEVSQAGDASGAAELLAQAGAVLDRALQLNQEQPSPDLCLAAARFKLMQFGIAHPDPAPAELAALRPETEQIAQLARQATELDPAVFEGYNLQAELTQRFAVGPDGAELSLEERAVKSLEIYEAAKDRTLTLRNLRAQLGDGRLLMMRRAFDLVIALQTSSGGRAAPVDLARAEAFYEDARIKYPEHPVTYYMQGQLQIVKNDPVGAIQALTQAYDKATQYAQLLGSSQARYWFGYVRVTRLPSEQLALLYMSRSQAGEAQRYAEAAVREFTEVRVTPPVGLVATEAELLRQVAKAQVGKQAQLEKAQEALAFLEEYAKTYPDDQSLRAVRIAVLGDLDRTEEAKKLMEQIPDTGAGTKLWRAQQAVGQEDYAAAESILREVLADAQATDEQFRESLQRLLDVLSRTQRRADARVLVAGMIKDPPRAGLTRLLKRYEFELAVDNPDALSAEERKELDAKRRAMIEETPDPAVRAQELLMFHESRGDWAEALKALDVLRGQYPGELRLTEEDFRLRLRLQQFDRAGELLATLAHHDNGVGFDRAGGATYRGDLELAKGNAEAAVREYRQAQQLLPKSSELEVKLARACLVAGRMAEGTETLQRAVRINPRSFEAYWLLTQLYRQKAVQGFGKEKLESEALAKDAEAKASELNPNHPEVLAWKREAQEESEPLTAIATREQQRATDPNDTANLLRVGQLYLRAWRQAADQSDAAQQNVRAKGHAFFSAVVPATTDETQTALARNAAEFYSLAKLSDEGRTLLENLIAQRPAEDKVEIQVLLAMFYEALGNNDAAEREYAQAQRLVREATPDVATRQRLDQGVGMAIIRFQERRERLDKVVEACRWLLDRLGSAADQARAGREVRLILIEALFNSGQTGETETELSDFLKVYPGDLRGLTIRTQVYLRQRDYARAAVDLNEILAKEPEDVLALYSRGRMALEAGQYDKARDDLTKAEQLLPRRPRLEPDLRRQLASLYIRRREYDLAATQYRALLDVLERQGAPAEQKQQVMRQSARLLYGGMDRFGAARDLISEYMEKHPDEPLWPYELGRLFEVQAENAERDARKARERGDAAKEKERHEAARQSYGSAVTYYQRAVDRAGEQNVQDRVGALIAQMNALTKAGRGAEAVELFRKVDYGLLSEELRDIARARLGMEAAKALLALKQDDAARQQWRQALRDASARSVALTADVASGLRDAFGLQPAEGLALLRQAAESTPVDEPAGQRLRLALATHLTADGNGAAALPLISEVFPKLGAGTLERSSALLTQARAQELTGDVEGAIRTYREILTADENNATALNNLAYTLVTAAPPLYAPAEARKYAERLRMYVPGNENAGTMLDTIGWVYFKNDELELAAASLEEAVSSGGASAAVYLHLGEAYQKLNRTVDARATLNQGLDKSRQDGDAEQVRQLEEALAKLGQ